MKAPFDLVPLAVRLRWQLSTNRLQRRKKRTRHIVVLAAVAYTVLNIAVLGQARTAADDQAAATLVLLMSSMALGWIFGPVLIGGVDETIDPTRLSTLPLQRAERYIIQLAGALSGVGPVSATVGLTIGLMLGHTGWGASIVIVPLATITAILLMVGAARSLAAVLAIAQRSAFGRDLAVLLAALVGGTIFTMAQMAGDVVGADRSGIIDVLGFAPTAWPAHAISAARAGHELAAIGWLLAAAAVAGGLHVLWARLSEFLLVHGERTARTKSRGNRALLNGARSDFGAAMSRQWIYLRRSPNNRVGIVFGTVFGVAFALVQIAQQSEGSDVLAAFGILLAMAANLGAATNVLGFDAGSLWIEVLAGGPTRAGIVARQLIALPNLLLPTWLSGVVVGVATGKWSVVLLVVLLSIPVAFVVLTFGVITSVVSPAPLPDMDNPFGNRMGNESRGVRIAVIAVVGLVTTVLLSAPIFVLLFKVLAGPQLWLRWLVPLAGLAYAGTLLWVASSWAGRYVRGREPGLLDRLAPRAFN